MLLCYPLIYKCRRRTQASNCSCSLPQSDSQQDLHVLAVSFCSEMAESFDSPSNAFIDADERLIT